MNPSFSSHLVNDVFGDPGLFVEVRWSKRALLFDLGHNDALGPTRLLRAGDIFISHTHMDHFIGFDALLRVALGRGKTLRLYGPAGLIANIEGKLHGYTWNLVDGYPLMITVQEFHDRAIRSATFLATDGFRRQDAQDQPLISRQPGGCFHVLEDPMFTVQAVALNHRIPSFAYSLQEQFHVNINRERLHEAGLPVGYWLKEVKQYLWQGKPDDFRFQATLYHEHLKEEREFLLGEVRERFITISRGQKLAYVVDARYDEENEAKVVELARGADIFYCEAPYLDQDADKARERYHLTARQAGLMARKAGVRELVVFHFSPRYTGLGHRITAEAQEAFRGS
ncbi:MAG: Metal-dependent hydrolases of the beta-lactamase superfamily III [Nitrospira sp.]|jgi:ribonuclease Z|nr:MAG: Metal-dependent hydrolases of the beta-lactamase superfamily III [Nitrospira sp.]